MKVKVIVAATFVAMMMSQANAAIVDLSYFGITFYGENFEANYRYNTTDPSIYGSVYTSDEASIYGGTQYGPSYVGPAISAQLKLDGVTVFSATQPNFSFNQFLALDGTFYDGSYSQLTSTASAADGQYLDAHVRLAPGELPLTLAGNFDYTVAYPWTFDTIVYYQYRCGDSSCSNSAFVTNIRERVEVSATPLPAALPLFGGGLAMLGLFARRRTKRGARVA